jgi:hypothetical protein
VVLGLISLGFEFTGNKVSQLSFNVRVPVASPVPSRPGTKHWRPGRAGPMLMGGEGPVDNRMSSFYTLPVRGRNLQNRVCDPSVLPFFCFPIYTRARESASWKAATPAAWCVMCAKWSKRERGSFIESFAPRAPSKISPRKPRRLYYRCVVVNLPEALALEKKPRGEKAPWEWQSERTPPMLSARMAAALRYCPPPRPFP